MHSSDSAQRWWFIGSSGSGKSTWSKRVAKSLGITCHELDATFHQPGWTPLPTEEFQRRVQQFAAGEAWVIEGNYTAARAIILARCTHLVALDMPRRVVMRQVIRRTLRRAVLREELWNGNREPWRNIFRWNPEHSIIRWAWTKWPIYRERSTWLEGLARELGVEVIRVRSHAQLAQELQRRGIATS